MPIYQAVENVLALKALAWDYQKAAFVSPSVQGFVWARGGLQAASCDMGHRVPDPGCTCGIYATYDIQLARLYTAASHISPIFLVEASGRTILYTGGFRTEELTVVQVAENEPTFMARMVAAQAADYFSVQVVPLDQMIITMDLFNIMRLGDRYQVRSNDLRGMNQGEIRKMIEVMNRGKNEHRA